MDAKGMESQELRLSALRCLDLFSAVVDSRPGLLIIQIHQQRFWAWANNLKVFVKHHVSLDAQLHKVQDEQHSATIREMLLLLLDILAKNLNLVLTQTKDARDESHNSHSKTHTGSNPLNIPLFGIEGSLKRLDKLAAVILKATEGSRARRIFAFAGQNRDENYEEHVARVLRFRFPHLDALSPGLSQALTDSFVHRYYKIQYDRNRQNREVGQPRHNPPAKPLVSPNGPNLVPRDPAQEPVENASIHDTLPLTIEKFDVEQELAKASISASQQPDATSVSETGVALYPKAPEISDGQAKAVCPICHKFCDAETFEGSKWMKHVDRDLQPYVCISEGCGEKLKYFSDRKPWRQHMRRTHTPSWIRYLHNKISWECPIDPCCFKPLSFESRDQLIEEHMLIAHSDIDKAELRRLAGRSGISLFHPVDVCPICRDTHTSGERPKEQSDELVSNVKSAVVPNKERGSHTEKNKVQFEDLSEESDMEDNTANPEIEPTKVRSKKEEDHKRIEKYIGRHLKALAFFFARPLYDQEDDEEDDEEAIGKRSVNELGEQSADEFSIGGPLYFTDPPILPDLSAGPIEDVFEKISSDIYYVPDMSSTEAGHWNQYLEKRRLLVYEPLDENLKSLQYRPEGAPSLGGHRLQSMVHTGKIEWPKGGGSYFIPNSILENYVTVGIVVNELRQIYPLMTPEKSQYYADVICKAPNQSKKIFIILLCGLRGAQKECIQTFVDEGITDDHLPFCRVALLEAIPTNPYNQPFTLCTRYHSGHDPLGHTLCGIRALSDWDQEDIGDLYSAQWMVQAPTFQLSPAQDLPHLDLDLNVVMPYIEDQEFEEGKVKAGGFAEVWGVRIHYSHQHLYKPFNSETETPLLAVKRLFARDFSEFKYEVDMLKALAHKRHKHLVKLLATYTLKGRYYLLFPFASSNLREHWDSIPEPNWNQVTYFWSLDQMTGLASGLNTLHNFRTKQPLDLDVRNARLNRGPSAMGMNVEVTRGEELYGRHGDLKPENILCSIESPETDPILQIADFGLDRFHRFGSSSNDDPKRPIFSITYEPPEISLGILVSRGYDIWSLGCIYLEFITWLLEGSSAIYDFSEARSEIAPDGVSDDTFFSLKVSEANQTDAEVRTGVVIWMERLRQSERCSSMIRDVLDMISNEMLQVQARDRINSAALTSKLKGFLERARRDATYLLGSHHLPIDQDKGFRKPES